MPEYWMKPYKARAVRWLGDNRQEIEELAPNREVHHPIYESNDGPRRSTSLYYDEDKSILVVGNDLDYLRIGDWLVQYKNGSFVVMPHARFIDLFESEPIKEV